MIYAAPDSQGIPQPETQEASGSGDGTASNPMTVKAAIASGDNHMHLLPGLYRGNDSIINISARSDFTIMSDHASIDGEFLRKPMRMVDCHNFQVVGVNDCIGGFNLYNANHEVSSIASCTDGIFKGVGAWNDPPPIREDRTNDMVFGLNDCMDLHFGGCFGFGYGRKTFQIYRSIRTVVEDGWFRWDDWTVPTGNRMAIAPSYQSYDSQLINCQATIAGSWDPSVIDPNVDPFAVHLIANDAFNTSGDIWAKLQDPTRALDDTRTHMIRCTAYQPAGTRMLATTGIRHIDQDGTLIEDCNVVLASELARQTLNLSGKSNTITRTNLGYGQGWPTMIGNQWVQELVGNGVNQFYQNQLSAELIRRVEEATSQSRWTDVRWPEDFPT